MSATEEQKRRLLEARYGKLPPKPVPTSSFGKWESPPVTSSSVPIRTRDLSSLLLRFVGTIAWSFLVVYLLTVKYNMPKGFTGVNLPMVAGIWTGITILIWVLPAIRRRGH